MQLPLCSLWCYYSGGVEDCQVLYSHTIFLSFMQWLSGLVSGSTRIVIGAKVQPDNSRDKSRILIVVYYSRI